AAAAPLLHVVIMDLDIRANYRNPTHAAYDAEAEAGFVVSVTGSGGDLWFENLRVDGFAGNISFEGDFQDIIVRRSVVVGAFGDTINADGLRCVGVTGLRIEESLFDLNGHRPDLADVLGASAAATVNHHNIQAEASCPSPFISR